MRIGLASILRAIIPGCAFAIVAAGQTTDPVDAIKSFSDFQQIDLSRVLNGEILSQRGSLMNFPNGISAQTCYAMAVSAEEAAKQLQLWDPSPHPELKVFAFHGLHTPCQPADFQLLDFRSNQSPIRWLLDKTIATSPGRSELNLTREETRKLAHCVPKPAELQKVSECWVSLLMARASAFQQKGLDGTMPYEVGGETVSPADQLRKMLLEQIAISHEFLPILKGIGLLGRESTPSLTPFYYWTMFDADWHATISLGAVYLVTVGDHFQLADLEYYVNANYYTSATLYEVWPVQDQGKPAALVWRGDFFAAPTLRFTKGTERIAYGALMLQDIKKEIHCMQETAKSR
ncbi:MAG TPA: hypothetical protein VMP11_10095 [Verrucomicrobiae bacterium]|nr:hypothetical protein [Verrucomicrobiae bacterium]